MNMAPIFSSVGVTCLSCVSVCALALAAATASAQLAERAVFVANNGNLEGSVSVMTFNAAGNPVFRSKFVTGSRPNTSVFVPGTNAYGISLTPDGRFVAVSHTTSSTTMEQITILRVNADATLSPAGIFQTLDSPLELVWLSNTTLAVTRTNTSLQDLVIVYRYDREAATLTEIDQEEVGLFTAYLSLSPSRQFLFAPDSNGFAIYAFRVEADGTLTPNGVQSTGNTYALGTGISADGRFLYGGGGISNGSNKITGSRIEANGTLVAQNNSPYTSGGQSPKQVVVTRDNQYAFVAHGTDATVRSFRINQVSGSLLPISFVFDVGLQGTLGTIEVLENLLLITDNSTATDNVMGLYAFTILPDGTLASTGPIRSTTGTAPQKMAAWVPSCLADFNRDGQVDFFDYLDFVAAFAAEDASADFNGDGQVDFFDYLDFVQAFADEC
jgi:6-phosphogluconolactonase (cycloisomerase 2 family)